MGKKSHFAVYDLTRSGLFRNIHRIMNKSSRNELPATITIVCLWREARRGRRREKRSDLATMSLLETYLVNVNTVSVFL